MKQKLLASMKKEFGRDQRRIDHACRVLTESEKLLPQYQQADPGVVVAAAILHDIGIQAAERKHGSNAGHFQEIEGPLIAEAILKELSFPVEKVAEVLAIIGNHHSPGKVSGVNFQIVIQADQIINRSEEQ